MSFVKHLPYGYRAPGAGLSIPVPRLRSSTLTGCRVERGLGQSKNPEYGAGLGWSADVIHHSNVDPEHFKRAITDDG